MKGRRVPPLTPAQIRQDDVATVLPTDADWDRAEERGTLGKHTIAVGICQSEATSYWHAWVSLYGTDVTSVGVYGTEPEAQALVQAISAVLREWKHDDASVEALNELIAWGARDTVVPQEALTLPNKQVRDILAQVAEQQERRN